MGEGITKKFSDMEIDAIGEILNISLGSSATSISELLEQPVNITTPTVKIMKADDFGFQTYEPAIGVEINYVKGLLGKNIMIMKESDVEIIVGLLLKRDYSEEKFVLDEMSIGAICEVMNQMMGAASTALSQFLNRLINISPPNSFPIGNSEQFKKDYFDIDGDIVAVYFNLMIGDLINSEFINVMTTDFAKELISVFNLDSNEAEAPSTPAAEEKEPERAPAEPAPEEPRAPAAAPAPPKKSPEKSAQAESYSVAKASYPQFNEEQPVLTDAETNNLNLIMSIPLQITVEIGRTTRKIKDILEFSPGMIVEMDKQAGSQVDVFVNGKAIAKGDVVVVNDFYGVRITEITSSDGIMKLL